MATTFETEFGGSPSDQILDQFGETMTHTDVSANTTASVTTIPGPSRNDGNVQRRTFRYKTADSSLVTGDTITDSDSVVWVIDETPDTDTTSLWTVVDCVAPQPSVR